MLSLLPLRRPRAIALCAAPLAAGWICVGSATPALAAGAWTAPLPGPPQILTGFSPPAHPWQAGHRGVDLVAEPGTPVRAAGAGVITFAGTIAGRGVVAVDHGSLRTTYEPVSAVIAVGTNVSLGQQIGTISSGGHCSNLCLHWGLLRDGGSTSPDDYLNPLSLLDRRSAILKPLTIPPTGRTTGDSVIESRTLATTPSARGGPERTGTEQTPGPLLGPTPASSPAPDQGSDGLGTTSRVAGNPMGENATPVGPVVGMAAAGAVVGSAYRRRRRRWRP